MKQSATTKAALPERIHIDGLNARLIIGTPDKATCSTATFAAELVLRWNAHEQLVGLLKECEALASSAPYQMTVGFMRRLSTALAQLERPA